MDRKNVRVMQVVTLMEDNLYEAVVSGKKDRVRKGVERLHVSHCGTGGRCNLRQTIGSLT